jgi:hypothetical protein
MTARQGDTTMADDLLSAAESAYFAYKDSWPRGSMIRHLPDWADLEEAHKQAWLAVARTVARCVLK